MRSPYSATAGPPALCLQVGVSRKGRDNVTTVLAKIDTGAGVSVIPDDVRKRLGLKPRGKIKITGVSGRPGRYEPRYSVTLAIAQRSFDIRPVSRPRKDALIGRDVLNQLVLNADGPAQVFELTGAPGTPGT